MKEIPEYLYHYTSIESLAMILSSRCIRFTSLNQVDDITEGKCKDIRHIGKYIFVSSWTDEDKESLPFWNMYTPKMRGVRIKIPTDMFEKYLITTDGVEGIAPGLFQSIVPQNETYRANYWILPTHDNFLFKVSYTENNDDLYPNIQEVNGDRFTIHLNKIGLFKSKHWEFQSEWRFLLRIFPITSKEPAYLNSSESNILSDSIYSMRKGDLIPFSSYNVNINPEIFHKMEILLGPKHTVADKIIVESLINKYNPNAALSISGLHQKIR